MAIEGMDVDEESRAALFWVPLTVHRSVAVEIPFLLMTWSVIEDEGVDAC
jgi:hypothetical protein